MIKVKPIDGTWTFLLFPSGRYRLMGNVADKDTIITFITDTIDATISVPIVLQTETFVFCLPYRINLQLFSESKTCLLTDISYEPELFPAMRLLFWNPILVNIFNTGKVVVMGGEARIFITEIFNHVHRLFLPTSHYTFV